MPCLLFQSIFIRSRFEFGFPLGPHSSIGTHSSAHGWILTTFTCPTGLGLAGKLKCCLGTARSEQYL